MAEEEQTDPLEITKEPEIVKCNFHITYTIHPLLISKNLNVLAAQNELSKVDVLVCGECHEVYHYVEQFQDHKTGDKCTKESVLKQASQANSKSQIWGFMLWKNAKFKTPVTEDTSQPSSWNVYQLWCNLDQTQKDSWIAAGKSLQAIHNITATTPTATVSFHL